MKNNLKGILIGIITIILIFVVYINWNSINSIFLSKASKNVDSFLSVINIENPTENDLKSIVSILSTEYIDLISVSRYYKVESWNITKTEQSTSSPNYTKVFVEGSTKNTFGVDLNRNPIFIVDAEGQIVDSYNFIVQEKYRELNKSDMEIFDLISGLKEKIKIEKWSWTKKGYFTELVEGKVTIYNSSEIPVSFVKLKIEYYNKFGTIINSDETYIIGADDLLPNQRRIATWRTFNCEDAEKAHIELVF